MMSEPDEILLRKFVMERSEAAFSELVSRHLDWVHSSALRQVMDHALAEDVSQSAFLALARQSGEVLEKVSQGAPLSAWLHVTVRNLAVKLTRGEARRRAREQEACVMSRDLHDEQRQNWEAWSPHLDEALGELGEADRHALLMRFFERRTAREIGDRLGISEEAAQKRISRAAERLRSEFARRGMVVSASSLAATLTLFTVGAAPSGLAATISSVAIASLPASAGFAWLGELAKHIFMIKKGQICVLGAAMIVGVIPLRHQQSELAQLKAEIASHAIGDSKIARLPNRSAVALDSETASESQEIARLRAELELLRSATPGLPEKLSVPAKTDARVKLELGKSVPFNELEFAGNAVPEAALQSSLALERVGDVAGTLAVTLFSPRTGQEFQELMQSPEKFAQVAERMKSESAKVERVSMVRKRVFDTNRVMIELALIQASETNLHLFNLARIGEGWMVMP